MQITIHKAKSQLSHLIQMAISGEEIIIAKGRTPLVKLDVLPGVKIRRRLGGVKGLVEFMADDFDAELDDFKDYSP